MTHPHRINTCSTGALFRGAALGLLHSLLISGSIIWGLYFAYTGWAAEKPVAPAPVPGVEIRV